MCTSLVKMRHWCPAILLKELIILAIWCVFSLLGAEFLICPLGGGSKRKS